MENHNANNNNASNDANNAVGNIVSMENLNSVMNWVSASVISAFFNSLERFSCVNISTTDPDEDDYEDEAKDRPLTLNANSHLGDAVADLPV